ncbi:hypothetical protein H8E77_32960 [bacterium]|nr:hypothetical protein [bacterium]
MPVNTAYRHLGVVKTPTELPPAETPPLPEGKYNVIYADPPWQYDNAIRSWGPAALHYPTMSQRRDKGLYYSISIDI